MRLYVKLAGFVCAFLIAAALCHDGGYPATVYLDLVFTELSGGQPLIAELEQHFGGELSSRALTAAYTRALAADANDAAETVSAVYPATFPDDMP